MPRKDVKKRLFLSNSCIDNSEQNWYTRAKMSDTISSRLNYSIKLSNRAVTPPPSMWLLARTPFPISHQNGVFFASGFNLFGVSFWHVFGFSFI